MLSFKQVNSAPCICCPFFFARQLAIVLSMLVYSPEALLQATMCMETILENVGCTFWITHGGWVSQDKKNMFALISYPVGLKPTVSVKNKGNVYRGFIFHIFLKSGPDYIMYTVVQ